MQKTRIVYGGKMEIKNGKFAFNEEEILRFESFLQYGNLKNAKYVFVGMEEGLWRYDYQENIEGRLAFLNHYKEFVHFLDDQIGFESGWYVTDTDKSSALLTVINSSLNKRGLPESWGIDNKIDQTMRMQIRLTALLEGNLDVSVLNSFKANNNYLTYPLHKRGGVSAMVDWYPLPKRNKTDFPYIVPGKYENLTDYYEYYDREETMRKKIINKLYDTYPMDISFVYIGKKDGKFKLHNNFRNLGFEFTEYNTGCVPEDIHIQPSNRAKTFIIGHRKRKDGHIQLAVMTPFFGMGQFSFDDINVVAAWVHEERKKLHNA